ncbi:hypothetical protein M378DRAFT_15867 [Amanita muscaria Koide BX008]|uniref:C2H2-type domain-containing protein n=1 Tax=Amanita muscaria (strain Koide BX008) TaxID=946122 RepID=A0A0C2W9Y7_AMAMK|nr:hypothetical protein M378DRAFT_15867 [Amanita muscaria Koide BX008]
MPRSLRPRNIPCSEPGCTRFFTNQGGLSNHRRDHIAKARLQPQHQVQQPEPDVPIAGDSDEDLYGPGPGSPGFFPSSPTSHTARVYNFGEEIRRHPLINGRPCNYNGEFLPNGTPPPPWDDRDPGDYSPFTSREAYEAADLLYRRNQMPEDQIDDLLQIWARTLTPDSNSLFLSARDLYSTLDAIDLGEICWQSFSISFQPTDEVLEATDAPWKSKAWDIWYRDPREVLKAQLSNRDFANEMDFASKIVVDREKRTRRYQDFMSGEWAWEQSDILACNDENHGSTFCPIILGSDKTTVSVATGHNVYYPLYMSNGLIHNNVRRAHRNGVSLIAFLATAKTDKEYDNSKEFRNFRRELFHGSLRHILQSLRPGMLKPEVLRYADGHYRRTIFGVGPYIADYPEQVLLCCTVQGWCPKCDTSTENLDGECGRRTHEHTEALMEALDQKTLWFDYGIIAGIMPFTADFPRANIHELIAPDILHQVIKGTFKDHLVTWVEEYISSSYPAAEARRILADIDRRIAVVPPFPGIRRFPEGRGFKQWTGSDSKALMKVYLQALMGRIPPGMVRTIAIFTEFCYIVRRHVLDDNDIDNLNELLAKFHKEREIFRAVGVRPDGFCLPRQHSLHHYSDLIMKFGAPNGLCSSITESKHIKAVKKPWRRSSRFNALSQMLLTNQRLDKLAAITVEFRASGMLDNSIWVGHIDPPAANQPQNDADEDEDGEAIDDRNVIAETKLAVDPSMHNPVFCTNVQLLKFEYLVPNIPRDVEGVSAWLGIPCLSNLISQFLTRQERARESETDLEYHVDAPRPITNLTQYTGKITVYPSAASTFFAPSDKSGLGGMFRERIHAVPVWRNGSARYDCVFVEHEPDLPGFRGLHVGQVYAFFKIKHNREKYPCAVVNWFSTIGDAPCPITGMWKVRRDVDENGERILDVIHIDTILRSAHLIGIAGDSFIPHELEHTDSLNAFKSFYVNKFIDYHAHEIAF